MSASFEGYVPFNPECIGPLNTLSREDARQLFERLMESRTERCDAITRLAAANKMQLDRRDGSLLQFERWMIRNVQPRPSEPARPLDIWLAAAWDFGVLIGETMIERRSELHWELCTSNRRLIDYQWPVIRGFDMPKAAQYYVSPLYSLMSVLASGLNRRSHPGVLDRLLGASGTSESQTKSR